MAATSFYNDNANRSYPFVTDLELEAFSIPVPNSAIVECGFMLGPSSGFVAGTYNVFLVAIKREGDQFTFVFDSDAPGLTWRQLRFIRSLSDPTYTVEYADTEDNQEASVSESLSHSCNYPDDFIGHLVTGPLTALAAVLADGQTTTGSARVEPARNRSLVQGYARSLNLANADRTRYETPDGCRDQCWPHNLAPLYVRATCMTGPLRFKEGYNIRIDQDNSANSLTFSAEVGAGVGEPCEQVPLFADEQPPADSIFYEGGPACNEVIRSINGIGGRVVNVTGGLGVTVTPRPAYSEIIINVDTLDMAICAEPVEDLDCESISESVIDCACGPV